MTKRFGRNQRRKMREQVLKAQQAALHAQQAAMKYGDRLQEALRDQLSLGKIPLEVEHFLSRDGRDLVMRAIFDERRADLHCQHIVTPSELRIQRDREERERFGQYLGRAIADRLADAYAGQAEGSSRGGR